MAFLKFSVVMAVLATACAAPQFVYQTAAPPPPPHPVHVVRPAPPPPPPAVYHAAPAPYHAAPAPVVPIVSQSYDANPDGSYTFSYESGDGSQRQEQGISRFPPGHEGPGGVAVQGRYVYASPEGPIQVEYIADENGYQPSGAHIHPEIVKAVAAQVAYARSEGPVAYNAPPPPAPPAYARAAYAAVPYQAYTPVPPPPPAYPYKS